MLRINEIKAPLGADTQCIKQLAAKAIGVSTEDFLYFSIVRESIDCRRKDRISMIYSVDVRLDLGEESLAAGFTQNKVSFYEPKKYELPENKRVSQFRPVIVGFGPAGMFCGLLLAKAGLSPLIVERGHDVDTRTQDVKRFWAEGRLNEDSNVQFGEGGAGTFSDGKLTTGIKDGRTGEVLRLLCEFGAPSEIVYSSRPHIGTDKLGAVVKNIRKEIIRLGGEVRFGCRLKDIYHANDFIQGVSLQYDNGEVEDLETDCLVLCTGHSARDTVEMLYSRGLRMERKAFSIGTRIEHPQELINKAQYGSQYKNPLLPPADYKLSNHPLHGRGGYTFCMCPGGTVVCASSEAERVVVNGMSEYARDGENANSAILIGIEPDCFEDSNIFAGIELQRKIESAAYLQGGCDYKAPCQTVGDFLKGRSSKQLGSVRPTCPTGVNPTDIRLVLPEIITNGIRESILAFDKKLHGFALPEAVLTAPESRSSSPVRITRDEFYQANIRGVYPCGEGAGYAGGIVSAAVDGLRCAQAVMEDITDY